MNGYAPIVLFTYCRKRNTQQVIESLLQNVEAKDSDLIIFSDAAKNIKAEFKVSETRSYLKTLQGFKSITLVEREQNYGLARNIMQGVADVVNKYGKIIVLEDDMTVSKHFLRYMNDGLKIYQECNEVCSLHGYVFPYRKLENLPETFFVKGGDCWGWATWKRAWNVFNPNAQELYEEIKKRNLIKQFEFDYSYGFYKMLKLQAQGMANSWAICWYASTFLKNMLTLYPNKSLIRMNGLDGEGATHGEGLDQSRYITDLNQEKIVYFSQDIRENEEARKLFKEFHLQNKALVNRLSYLLRRLHIRI